MAFYALEADNFEYLTNELVYPALIKLKTRDVPEDGKPEHTISVAEELFFNVAQTLYPALVVRREVLLSEICKPDEDKIFDLLRQRHSKRLEMLGEIKAVAKMKIQNIIGDKRCDFLLYDNQLKSLKLIIEVDGLYHLERKQRSNDYAKNLVFMKLGVPLLRLYSLDVECAFKLPSAKCDEKLHALLVGAMFSWEKFKKDKNVDVMQRHLPKPNVAS